MRDQRRAGADPAPARDLGADARAACPRRRDRRPRARRRSITSTGASLRRGPSRRSRGRRAGGCSRSAGRCGAISSCVASAQLLGRVGQSQVVELGRLGEPIEVVPVAEDRRAALGLVAADALEDAGAVVQAMGEHVHLGVLPGHELAVVPNQIGCSIVGEVCPTRRALPRRPSVISRGAHLDLGRDLGQRCVHRVPLARSGCEARPRERHRQPLRCAPPRPAGRGRGAASSPPKGTSPAGWRSRLPAMSGAEPWTGSNRPGVPSAPRLAEGNIPSEPVSIAASSLRMSPKRFSVRITSKPAGRETSCIAALSTSRCSSATSG